MPFNINEIRSQLTGGGARPNLFHVVLPFPAAARAGIATTKLTFTCKAAQLPGADIAPIEVPYFGRAIKLAGTRTFAEWTTTVIQDEDFSVHNAINRWMNSINTHETNVREAGTAPNDYQTTADVIHFGKDGVEIKTVKLINMWPSSIAPIDLAWDNNELEEFQCTWTYDYWTDAETTT